MQGCAARADPHGAVKPALREQRQAWDSFFQFWDSQPSGLPNKHYLRTCDRTACETGPVSCYKNPVFPHQLFLTPFWDSVAIFRGRFDHGAIFIFRFPLNTIFLQGLPHWRVQYRSNVWGPPRGSFYIWDYYTIYI